VGLGVGLRGLGGLGGVGGVGGVVGCGCSKEDRCLLRPAVSINGGSYRSVQCVRVEPLILPMQTSAGS